MKLKKICVENNEFLELKLEDVRFIFSTGGVNFSKNDSEGLCNLDNITKWFNVEKVHYLNQIHSDIILNVDDDENRADGLITNKKEIAIGIFTADCVPVLMYDKINKVVAAVHSGWRGTYNHIVIKALKKMKDEYNTKPENVVVCIGPHIRKCCYEVSVELIDKFKKDNIYDSCEIYDKCNHLSLENCILAQLDKSQIKKENIITTNLCTHCSEKYKFYSYRRNKDAGRQFSFIYIK